MLTPIDATNMNTAAPIPPAATALAPSRPSRIVSIATVAATGISTAARGIDRRNSCAARVKRLDTFDGSLDRTIGTVQKMCRVRAVPESRLANWLFPLCCRRTVTGHERPFDIRPKIANNRRVPRSVRVHRSAI